MYCQICGKNNREGARSCVDCGMELTSPEVNEKVSNDAMPKRVKINQPDNMNSHERAAEEEMVKNAIKSATRSAGTPYLLGGIAILFIAFLILTLLNTIVTFLWVIGAFGVIIGLYLIITGGGEVSQKSVDDILEDSDRKQK